MESVSPTGAASEVVESVLLRHTHGVPLTYTETAAVLVDLFTLSFPDLPVKPWTVCL